MSDIYKKAAQKGLRYDATMGAPGNLNTEDLWHISLENLDKIVCTIKKGMKVEKSYLTKTSPENLFKLHFEVAEDIIKTRLQDQEDRKEAASRKAQKDKIMSIMASKQSEELASKTLEELQEELDKL